MASSRQNGKNARTAATAAGSSDAGQAQTGEFLTTAQGLRLPDTDHSLKAGQRGPTLLEDFHLREKITHSGIPRSYRTMEGFGVHTFRLVNEAGEAHLVKFHWKPAAGVHSLVWEEAQIAAGVDPDFHRRDMADSIDAGAFLGGRPGGSDQQCGREVLHRSAHRCRRPAPVLGPGARRHGLCRPPVLIS